MIRIATKDDIPAIRAIYAPYVETTTYTFEYTVPTLAEMNARFEAITTQFPWLVWEENGTVLGYAYGSAPFDRAAYRWCGEVSVYLAPDARRKGLGRKLYAAVEAIMWQQGYRVIYALITSENEASLRFHEAVGYVPSFVCKGCGIKFGRLLDVHWLEKRSKLVDIPSVFPASWKTFVENDGNLQDILANLSLS